MVRLLLCFGFAGIVSWVSLIGGDGDNGTFYFINDMIMMKVAWNFIQSSL